jgi:hypothetical protein
MKNFLFALTLVVSSGCSMGVAPYRGISYGGATYGTGYGSSGGFGYGPMPIRARAYRVYAAMDQGLSATVRVQVATSEGPMVLGGGPITVGSMPGMYGEVNLPLPPSIPFGTTVMIDGQCSNGHMINFGGPMSDLGAAIHCPF